MHRMMDIKLRNNNNPKYHNMDDYLKGWIGLGFFKEDVVIHNSIYLYDKM